MLVGVAETRTSATHVNPSADDLSDRTKVAAFERAQGAVTFSLPRLQELHPPIRSQADHVTPTTRPEGTENRAENLA